MMSLGMFALGFFFFFAGKGLRAQIAEDAERLGYDPAVTQMTAGCAPSVLTVCGALLMLLGVAGLIGVLSGHGS